MLFFQYHAASSKFKHLHFQSNFNPLSAIPQNGQTQTIRRQIADELFECVWPFYEIGAKRVKPSTSLFYHMNSFFRTFVLICFAVSIKKIDEFGSLLLILVFAPCRAGKNVEWINAGLCKFNLGATSRVILKYGS